MVFLVIDFLVCLFLILDIDFVHLSLKDHVLVELIICIHERRSEVLIHHFFDSQPCEIFAWLRFVFYGFQLNVIEVGLNFELELFSLVNDKLPKRVFTVTLFWMEQELGESLLLCLGADNH